MIGKKFSLRGIEILLNKFISLDKKTKSELIKLKGKIIGIDIESIPIIIYFKINLEGYLELSSDIEDQPDATIKGGLLDLIKANDKTQSNDQLFSGRIRIEGDLEIAQSFSKILGNIDIDWEEELSKIVGDFGAVRITKGIKNAREEFLRFSEKSQKNISDYLTEESKLLPHRYEFESFQREIENFRDSVERLSAQIFIQEKSIE